MATAAKSPTRSASKSLWRDEFIFRAYELAKEGLADKGIYEALGVNQSSYLNYLKKRPIFAMAVAQGRALKNGTKGMDFLSYVYRRLPDDLKEVWRVMRANEKQRGSMDHIEALLASKGRRARQILFVHALISSNWNASEACRLVNIPAVTFRHWLANDPDFEALVLEMDTHKKNFFEGSLINLVAQGDPGAIIFANRTVNADRGYAPTKNIDLKVSGSVTHQHEIVVIDDLQLPLDVRKAILEAHRQRKSGMMETTAKRIVEDDDDR